MENSEIPVVIGDGAVDNIMGEVDRYSEIVLMISKNVEQKYGDIIPKLNSVRGEVTKISLNDGEALKNIRNYQKVMRVMVERQVSRNSLLTYIGGGTVGDLSGYIASTYKRGIPMISVPTTLLSMVDSAIGGKNGINFSGVKNVIGTFYSPMMILSDTRFLHKLEPPEVRDGLSEIIKYGAICDHTIMSMLDSNQDIHSLMSGPTIGRLISKCIRTKGDIVAKDYYDQLGERGVLNFGHTIGHAIESVSKNEITHGVAVATGMVAESYIGEKIGATSARVRQKIQETLGKFSIGLVTAGMMNVPNLVKFITNDKKASDGHISMHVPTEIGKSQKIRISLSDVQTYLRSFTENYNLIH